MRRTRYGKKITDTATDMADGELRLLRLATKGRVLRFFYTNTHFDVVDRGLLASTYPASTETLEAMVGKGWLDPMPSTSRHGRMQWSVTDTGLEAIAALTQRRKL